MFILCWIFSVYINVGYSGFFLFYLLHSDPETKFHTGAVSSSSGGAAQGTGPCVTAAWVSPAKADNSAARSGISHRLSTLDNVTISFSPKSVSCASIYAEVGPPLCSPSLVPSQATPFSLDAHGPCLTHSRTGAGGKRSTTHSFPPIDHPYDTPEAIVHKSVNRCTLSEATSVPSACAWDADSGSVPNESSNRCRAFSPSDTITSGATGDSWFGRWSPVFITQQQPSGGATKNNTDNDILFLTVQPPPLDNDSISGSPQHLSADDRDFSQVRLLDSTSEQLNGCYTPQPVGGVIDSPDMVQYLQPSATAISSELSLAMFDDDDIPLPISCESRPASSSTPNLCHEPIPENIADARNRSATAPTVSSRSPSSSSGYTDMSKYSGDYERDPLYMAVQRMRASRARDSREDGKRDTGVFSEAEGLYSPLSWIGNGVVPDTIGASGYQSLDTTTKSPTPTYTKPFRVSSQESCV